MSCDSLLLNCGSPAVRVAWHASADLAATILRPKEEGRVRDAAVDASHRCLPRLLVGWQSALCVSRRCRDARQRASSRMAQLLRCPSLPRPSPFASLPPSRAPTGTGARKTHHRLGDTRICFAVVSSFRYSAAGLHNDQRPPPVLSRALPGPVSRLNISPCALMSKQHWFISSMSDRTTATQRSAKCDGRSPWRRVLPSSACSTCVCPPRGPDLGSRSSVSVLPSEAFFSFSAISCHEVWQPGAGEVEMRHLSACFYWLSRTKLLNGPMEASLSHLWIGTVHMHPLSGLLQLYSTAVTTN